MYQFLFPFPFIFAFVFVFEFILMFVPECFIKAFVIYVCNSKYSLFCG